MKTDILDALEALGEHSTVKYATVSLRLATNADVDEMYTALGPTVDETGRPLRGQSSPPEWVSTTDGTGHWREAATTVAGIRVILTGPMRVGRERKAA